MHTPLLNRRALVGGSTQGIGLAAARALAELGAEVVLLARNEDRLASVAAELPTPVSQSHGWIQADFTAPDSVRDAVNSAADPFHILVHNTGGPPGGPIIEADAEAFVRAFSMHLITGQHLVQALLPGFREARYGRVINVISTSVKAPIAGLGVSNTIRGAVASWAKTLATELAPHGITVNNVLPGFTDTGRLTTLFETKAQKTGRTVNEVRQEAIASIPAARLGQPEEVAAAIAFLATPAAAYINGINLPVDGGRTPSL